MNQHIAPSARDRATSPLDHALVRTGLAVCLALVVLGAHQARAQRHRPPARISVAAAQRSFDRLVAAAGELLRVELQPADANGQLRAWDSRWSRYLAGLRAQNTGSTCQPIGGTADCRIRAADALACNAYYDVELARGVALETPYGRRAWDVLPAKLDARAQVAREALRRQAHGLSCEDLPQVYEVFAELGDAQPPLAPGTDSGAASGPSSPVDDNPYD